MFIKFNLYVEVTGSVKDPSLFAEIARQATEKRLLSDGDRIEIRLPKQVKLFLKARGEDPKILVELISHEVVFDGLR